MLSSKGKIPLLGSVESRVPIAVTNEGFESPLADLANEPYCRRICAILTNFTYLFIMLSLAMFWFMVCGA